MPSIIDGHRAPSRGARLLADAALSTSSARRILARWKMRPPSMNNGGTERHM